MTPKEKTVIRAIIDALANEDPSNMDALATSYILPTTFFDEIVPERAAMLLEALINDA